MDNWTALGAAAAVALAAVYACIAVSRMWQLRDEEMSPERKRKITRHAYYGVGVFEIGVAALLATMGQWVTSPALALVGLGFIYVARHPEVTGRQ